MNIIALIPGLALLAGALLGLAFKPSREEERSRIIGEFQRRHNEEYLNEKP